MGVDIASLVLAVDSTQVDKGSSSLDRLAKAGGGASDSAAVLANAGSLMTAAMLAAAGATAVLVRQAINAADAMNDMHLRTGLAFKELAAYELLAKQSGSTLEGVAQGFKFLGKNMIDNADELATLGVTSKNTSEAMGQFADLIASINDPALKTTLAMKYLGRAGVELIPTLSGGSAAFKKAMEDSKAYGEALEKAAPAADEFNDQMAILSIRVAAAAQELAIKFLPLLTELAKDATSAADDLGMLDIAFDPVLEAFKAAVILGGNVAFVFRAVGTEAGGMAAQLAALGRGDFAGFTAIGDAMKEDAAKARKDFDAWEKKVLNMGSASGAAPGNDRKKLSPQEEDNIRRMEERTKAAKKAADEYANLQKAAASFVDKAREEYAVFGMTADEKRRHEAQTISLTLNKGKERDAFIASANALHDGLKFQEDAIAAAKAHNEAMEDVFKEEQKMQDKINDGIKGIREQTMAIEDNIAKMLLTGEQLRQHIVLRAMEKSGLEASSAAYKDMKDRLNEALMNEEVAKKVKEETDKATEFAKQAARNIQDAFADGLFDIMEGKFDNLGKSFTTMINRMVANAMAANLGKYLMGDMGKTGEIGGMLGPLAGKLFGGNSLPAGIAGPPEPGLLDSLFSFLPKFATGTEFVPETGPAIVHRGEKITPAGENQKSSTSKSVIVTNNFTIAGSVDRRSQAQIAAEAGAAVNRAMRRNT